MRMCTYVFMYMCSIYTLHAHKINIFVCSPSTPRWGYKPKAHALPYTMDGEHGSKFVNSNVIYIYVYIYNLYTLV